VADKKWFSRLGLCRCRDVVKVDFALQSHKLYCLLGPDNDVLVDKTISLPFHILVPQEIGRF
jgi:hypothetical protein